MDCHSKKQWFSVEKINSNLFLITEPFFYEGNRCNIWLIKGGDKDLIIDCGLGVSNLRKFLEGKHLLDPIDKPKARTCIVVCTHVHSVIIAGELMILNTCLFTKKKYPL